MTTLFIRYARKDIAEFYPPADELQGQGYEVWIDIGGIKGGTKWSREIVTAIEKCD
jgi:hypothetical protein